MCQVPFRLVMLRPGRFAMTFEDSGAAAAAPAMSNRIVNFDAARLMANGLPRAQRQWQKRVGKALVTHRPKKPLDGDGSNGAAAPVGRRRVWAAMHHGGRDFD